MGAAMCRCQALHPRSRMNATSRFIAFGDLDNDRLRRPGEKGDRRQRLAWGPVGHYVLRAETQPGCVMDVIVGPLFWLINTVINLYIWVLIASAILSWLIAFDVVNTRNRVVYTIGDFLNRLTEPALRPIRRILPNLGGIDLSPLVLILLLLFVQQVLARLYIAGGL